MNMNSLFTIPSTLLFGVAMAVGGLACGPESNSKPSNTSSEVKAPEAVNTSGPVSVKLVSAKQKPPLPNPGVELVAGEVALVVTDPQNDFLHEKGVAWGVVGKSVVANNTRENIESLMKAAKSKGIDVFVSPHYYYPLDHDWKFGGALEKLMHKIKMFDRTDALDVTGFAGSGADWLERYKPYIEDGKTIVTNPHKVYGPETNDLVLQLRKRKVKKVILAGMSANLCVEAHMRELIEQGFEVAVVSDATAAAVLPDLDGYEAALSNFRFISNALVDTSEAVTAMNQL
jgi:nicotinamidase-related amidase